LAVEGLEDRLVPNVTFSARLGPEKTVDNGGLKLNDVPVYLIFWGSYWKNTQRDPTGSTPTVKEITDAASSILNGPYFKGLTQYGADGNAYLAGTASDTSDPPSGQFDSNKLSDIVDNLDDNGGLPEADDLSRIPIYVVVTPPGILSSTSGDVSYNTMQSDNDFPWTDSDQVPLVWLGGNQAGGMPSNPIRGQLDYYTDNFSHEVAEAITCIDSNGIVLTQYNGSVTGTPQIGDAEAQLYQYRLNGYTAQSFWSNNDSAFLVPDGNAHTVNVNNGVLTVNGDQAGVVNDTIGIDVVGSGPSQGGVEVTVDGDSFQFDPGKITSVFIKPGAGSNGVAVFGLPAGVNLTVNEAAGATDNITVNMPNGSGSSVTVQGYANSTVNLVALAGGDSVNINDRGASQGAINVSPAGGNWGNVQGGVSVYGNYTAAALNISDHNAPGAQTYNLDPTRVSRANAGAIAISGLSSLALAASTGADTINVSPLTHNLSGLPTLNIDGGDNSLLGVDDSSNTALTTYAITASALTRAAAGQPLVTINYAHVAGLTLFTGSAADTVNVESTPASTTVAGGAGSETFNVAPLSQNVGGINGTLRFQGGTGGGALTVNDQANPGIPRALFNPGTLYTVNSSSLTRSVYSPLTRTQYTITIAYSGLGSVTLNAGNNGPNTVNVESTSTPTYVNAGAATGPVNIAPTSENLDSVVGTVTVTGGSVNVFDQNNPHGAATGVPTSYAMYFGVARTSTFAKGSAPVTRQVYAFDSQGLTLYTSKSPNVVTVASDAYPTTIDSGAADTVRVTAFSVPIINVAQGTVSVTVANHLTVNAGGGTLTVDETAAHNDLFDTFSDAFTVTGQAVVLQRHWHEAVRPVNGPPLPGKPGGFPPRHAPTPLDATFIDTLNYSNVTALAIDGGPIASSFNGQSTAAGVPATVNASTGNQFVVGAKGSVKNIRSHLTLSGANDTLLVDDSQATTQDKVTVTPTQVGAGAADQFFGAGGSLTYGGISALTMNLSKAAADTVQLSPSAATAFFVNGDPTEFQTGNGAVLNLDLTGVLNALLTPGGPGAGTWTFGNRQPMAFKGMGAVHTH
jgi:hypothetical protein